MGWGSVAWSAGPSTWVVSPRLRRAVVWLGCGLAGLLLTVRAVRSDREGVSVLLEALCPCFRSCVGVVGAAVSVVWFVFFERCVVGVGCGVGGWSVCLCLAGAPPSNPATKSVSAKCPWAFDFSDFRPIGWTGEAWSLWWGSLERVAAMKFCHRRAPAQPLDEPESDGVRGPAAGTLQGLASPAAGSRGIPSTQGQCDDGTCPFLPGRGRQDGKLCGNGAVRLGMTGRTGVAARVALDDRCGGAVRAGQTGAVLLSRVKCSAGLGCCRGTASRLAVRPTARSGA